MIIHGDKDAVVPHKDVTTLVEKLKTQKGIVIEQKVIPERTISLTARSSRSYNRSATISTSV